MKYFLKKAAVFMLPVVLLFYGADYFFSTILKKSKVFADGEYLVWNDLYDGNVNAEVVIYGSSRALKHIDPKMLGDSLLKTAYNLGVNGHSFRSQYFRNSLLLKYNSKPEIIIQTLDVTSFEKESDLYNQDQFLPYMLNNEDMYRSVYNGFKLLDYKLPMIRFYGKKEAFLEICRLILNISDNKPVRIKGYLPWDRTWNNDLMEAQKKLGSLEVKSDSSMIQLFERYLNECNQKNIKLIFVYTPEYIEGQKFVGNRSDILALYYRLSKKFNIPFFDYSNDPISFQKDFFYNSGHLNRRGAELFTGKLVCDIKKSQILLKHDTGMLP
jgi:hypothetical protein